MKYFVLVVMMLTVILPLNTLAATANPPEGDPHAQLKEILNGPMYSAWRLRELHEAPEAEHRTFDRWLHYFSQKIQDFWDWLFPQKDNDKATTDSGKMGFLPGFLKGAAWIITIVGMGFIIVLIIQMIRSSNVGGVSAHILSRQQIEQAMEVGDALALNSSQWLDEAQRLAADQNFRMAYRALYLALLSGLHSLGKIDHNPNRTNWTYVQNYRGAGDERDLFARLTDLFDRTWYGHKNPGSENLPELRQTVRILTRGGSGA